MRVKELMFLMLISLEVFGQDFSAAPFLGMGNTGVGQGGIYSLTANPAGLVMLEGVTAAIAYQQHVLKSDIQTQAAYLGIPLARKGAIGLAIHNYGIPAVTSFLRSNLSYARSFGTVFQASISANYHRKHVQTYGGGQTLSADLGLQYSVKNSLNVGVLFRNVSGAKFDNSVSERIGRELVLGMDYFVSQVLNVNVDLAHDLEYHFFIRSGLAYAISPFFLIRMGVSSNPLQYYGGVGFVLNNITIDLSSSFHPRLGTSPQIALAYVL